MSTSGHLHVRLHTTASPDEVFEVLRGLALPAKTRAWLRGIGAPSVRVRPPRFRITLSSHFRHDLPLSWVGQVSQASSEGSLIVAHTDRSIMIWVTVGGVGAILASIGFSGLARLLIHVGPLFVMSILIYIAGWNAWHFANHLDDRDQKEALMLLEVFMKRLPNVSVLEVPKSTLERPRSRR